MAKPVARLGRVEANGKNKAIQAPFRML